MEVESQAAEQLAAKILGAVEAEVVVQRGVSTFHPFVGRPTVGLLRHWKS